MNFEVVIPTYKREGDLKKCLDSIYKQDLLPERIILVDDDSLPDSYISKERENSTNKGIELVHYIKNHSYEPRGSSESRNKGIEIATEEVIFIFDDDIILEDGFLRSVMEAWESDNDPNLIGVGGVITNNRKKGKLERIYNKIFGLSNEYSWDMNDIGFQIWDDGITKKEKGYYVHGGLSSYKSSLVNNLGGFVIAQGGRAGGEDPDFCLRAKNKGYFFIMEPNARAFHKESKMGREKIYLTGFKDTYNRKILFKNHCKKSIKNYSWFYWASFGWILRQFLVGNFRKGFGMIKGLVVKI